MAHLLRLDSSARGANSQSRALGDDFETAWLATPGRTVKRLDLAAAAPGHIENDTINGFYAQTMTPALIAATAQSDQLIADLQAADHLLITTPIYNFGVLSALKAWIDQVVRIGKTFSYDGQSFKGLVKADSATAIIAYGAQGYLNDGPLAGADFCAPYLRFLLGFLGVGQVDVIGLEGTTGDVAVLEAQTAAVRAQIADAAMDRRVA